MSHLGIKIVHDDILPPDVEARASSEYLEFYKQTYAGKPAANNFPPSTFQNPPPGVGFPGALDDVEVGQILELEVERKEKALPAVPIAVYVPEGEQPESGWPVVLSIHGGGWVLGTRHAESPINTRICKTASAVVVSPEYRRAPQFPFPAPVEDCWDVLLWLCNGGLGELKLDLNLFAIQGASAGGHLAAVLINMTIDLQLPKGFKFKFASLACPVTDVTAGDPTLGSPTWDNYKSWTENRYAPCLSINKMLWYRNLFVPNPYQRLDWHASPMLVPKEFWAQHPPTWVGVVELDILRDEGVKYAEALKHAGVNVTLEVYKGVAHPAVIQGKALSEGRRFMDDSIKALTSALSN